MLRVLHRSSDGSGEHRLKPTVPSVEPLAGRFFEAMREHGATAVILNSTVADTFMLVSILQLALRHPTLDENGGPAQVARAFVELLDQELGSLDPVFSELIKLGNRADVSG